MIATRNPLIASPALLGAMGPSPLLVAMVAEWEAVGRRLNDPALEDGPEADTLGNWYNDLQRAIYLFPAGSVLDLLTKVPVLQDEVENAVSDRADGIDPKDTLPGAAWFGLLRDIERLAERVGQAAPMTHNPILSRISEARAALGRALAVLADHRRDAPGDDLPPMWFEASDAAQEAFRRALAVHHPADGDDETVAALLFEDAQDFAELLARRYLGLIPSAFDA